MAKTHISFNLNGQTVDVLVEPRELLIHVIREQLQQTGSGGFPFGLVTPMRRHYDRPSRV